MRNALQLLTLIATVLPACGAKTDADTLKCLDARLLASNAWRNFASVASKGAEAAEAAADDAAAAGGADLGRLLDDAAAAGARALLAAQDARKAATRFRARAEQADQRVALLENPYMEIVGARAWGSYPGDPGGAELTTAVLQSEAAWQACRVECRDIKCSAVVAPPSEK